MQLIIEGKGRKTESMELHIDNMMVKIEGKPELEKDFCMLFWLP